MDNLERNIFGSVEIAYECLADIDRTANFYKAISEVINKNDRVLELGTGTGILALMAGKSGASTVDAYEIEKAMAEIARRNIKRNKLSHIINVIESDVTKVKLSPKKQYNVLIAEMITVGLIEEQLVPAFNNILRQKVLKNDAHAIPYGQNTYIELVETSFNYFGFDLETVQIEQTWQKSKLKSKLTKPMLLSEVDFNKSIQSREEINPCVDETITFEIMSDGIANGIRLASESLLSKNITSGWTQCMNSPAIIPIKPIKLSKGDKITAEISYKMGGEMRSFNFIAK